MEVTDTESGVSVLGPTNNVDIELMAKEMDYSSVKMMLLIMRIFLPEPRKIK